MSKKILITVLLVRMVIIYLNLFTKRIQRPRNFKKSFFDKTQRIDELTAEYADSEQLTLHYSDLLDSASISELINKILPDQIYNLAAQSHVAVSFQNPVYTSQRYVRVNINT